MPDLQSTTTFVGNAAEMAKAAENWQVVVSIFSAFWDFLVIFWHAFITISFLALFDREWEIRNNNQQ